MKIKPKPGITQEEILEELRAMTLDEILSIPLTGQVTGMFETFTEMSKFVEKVEKDKINNESLSHKESENE